MSLKDVPVRARLWAPDRSLPRFLGDFFFFLSDSTLRLLPSTFGRRKRAEVSLKRAVLHPRATIKYESVAQGSRAAPSGVIVPGELGAAPCSCRWRGSGGAVAWSCGHYIGHYIRHIRLIFGNFYYFCPEACHTASRPVPVTQGRSGIQTESVTDGRQVIYQSIAELIGLIGLTRL